MQGGRPGSEKCPGREGKGSAGARDQRRERGTMLGPPRPGQRGGKGARTEAETCISVLCTEICGVWKCLSGGKALCQSSSATRRGVEKAELIKVCKN